MNCDKTTAFLNALIVILAAYNLIVSQPPLAKWKGAAAAGQTRVTVLEPLLGADGGLLSPGWSSRYFRILNLDLARPHWMGVPLPHRWAFRQLDRFVFCFNRRVFYVTLASSGNLAVSSITFFDFETNELLFHNAEASVAPFGLRSLPRLADDPFEQEGFDTVFEGQRNSVRVFQGKNPMKSTFHTNLNLQVEGQLKAKLMTERFTAQNDFFEAVPVTPDRRAWAYSLRSYESLCEGFVSHMGKYHSLLHSNCVSVAAFDRGFHNYKTNWVWASAQGKAANGTHLALNFGEGVADPVAARSSEDFFKTAGVIHKLSPVELPPAQEDWATPIHFRTVAGFEEAAGSADVKFVPKRRVASRRGWFALLWDVEVVFGTFSGTVEGEAGARVSFEGLVGFVERARVKW